MEEQLVNQETQEQPAAPAVKTLAEEIEAATIVNYKEILERILQEKDKVVKEAHFVSLAKALKVSRSVLNEAIKETEKVFMGVLNAHFPELVDLVITDRGNVLFLVNQDGIPNTVDRWKNPGGGPFVPPERQHIPFELGRAAKVLEHFRNDSDKAVVKDVLSYLKRFSYLPEREWAVIAMCILLSYLQDHQQVRYIPVVYFYAVAERGKSRTAKSMLSIMYRGIHLVDMRPANIIRFAQNFNATLFFDCTEVWKTAEKYDCVDILLGRFEKGTQVARVLNPDAGPFRDQTFFDIYGSTIVATNEPANTTFESRCLTLTMPNKPGDYEDPKPELGIELKERLIAFRARNMTRTMPAIVPIPGISGRLWDITKPLFQMCQLFYPDGTELIKSLLLEMVGKKVEVKKETLEGKIVAAISAVTSFDGVPVETFKFEEITKRVNDGMPERMKYSPQRLGRVVESLSIKTKTVQGYSHVTITQEELERLKVQYGLAEEKIQDPKELPALMVAAPPGQPGNTPAFSWEDSWPVEDRIDFEWGQGCSIEFEWPDHLAVAV